MITTFKLNVKHKFFKPKSYMQWSDVRLLPLACINNGCTHIHEFEGHMRGDIDALCKTIPSLAALALSQELGCFLPVCLTTPENNKTFKIVIMLNDSGLLRL